MATLRGCAGGNLTSLMFLFYFLFRSCLRSVGRQKRHRVWRLTTTTTTTTSSTTTTVIHTISCKAQYTKPPTPTWLNCRVESRRRSRCEHNIFATSSRRLPTDSVNNFENDQTDSIAVWLREFWSTLITFQQWRHYVVTCHQSQPCSEGGISSCIWRVLAYNLT